MRVLLGGLVGAAASAAAWFLIEYATKQEFGWLAIAVGLVTGLCVNAAAPAGAAQSYGRAALAVVLALVAIVGGRMVYAKAMQNVSQVKTVMPAAPPAEASAKAEEAAEPEGTAKETVAAAVELDDRSTTIAPTGNARIPKPTVNTYKELEVVWMALAALAAYLTGKGSGKAGPVAVDSTLPEGTAGTPA